MFVREKSARGHTYLYLVENEREGGRVRQRIIRALGRKEVLLASGELDRLAASLVRHCDRAVILSDMEAGRIACTRIGGPLLFGRLWERLGIAEVPGELQQGEHRRAPSQVAPDSMLEEDGGRLRPRTAR